MSFADWGNESGGIFAGGDDWGGGGGLGSMFAGADWLTAGSNVLGQALRGAPAGPSISSAANRVDQIFDNSGWVVTFGNENEVETDLQRSTERSDTAGLALPGGSTLQTMLIIVAGVLIWKKLRKS